VLFGSLARDDWDGFSDVDLLAVAPTQAQASQLADALVAAGLGDDVIALSSARWQQLQASGDLAVARLTAKEGFHAQACYHAGQAAKKALKGLLVACGVTPPYSHSLDRLLEATAAQGLDSTALQALPLKALTRMNTASRDPQDGEAPVDRFDRHDSEQALFLATCVVGFATSALRGEGDAPPSG
jgi:HEPN domain-containing protein